MGALMVTVVVLGLLYTVQITSQTPSNTEAFFQGSCEKWNPCSQMCLNMPQTRGFECRCAVGFTLNTDGFSCDELPSESSTRPAEVEVLHGSENRAHIEIVHHPGKSNQYIEEIRDFDDATHFTTSGTNVATTSDTNIVDHEQYLKKLANQKHSNNQNSTRESGNLENTLTNLQGETKSQKKWSYGNYYRPSSYSNGRLHYDTSKNKYYSNSGYLSNSNNRYYNQAVQSDSPQNQVYKTNSINGGKTPNRDNKPRKGKGGKGRKKGKGKNKNKGSRNKGGKNKGLYDGTQSDDAKQSKYESKSAGISNSVLEEELKEKADTYQYNMKSVKYHSCSQLSCKNGAKCVPDEMRGGFRCQCKLGTEGEFCQQTVMVRYPQFTGIGYMAFPVLQGAYRQFDIEIEFRADVANGLLLFSSEYPNARSDFFSITLVDEKVELRFDCGTGPAVVTSSNKIQMGKWNTVTVHRKDWTGTLTLNSGPPSTNRSQGFFQRITFREDLYLGGYKNLSLIGSRAGMQWGFVGCVRRFQVNGKNYDMRKGQYVGDAIHGMDVGECSAHTCDHIDCLNGGRCEADSADTSVCLCPVGVAGDRCESKIDIYIPSFDGTSYLQYLGLRRRVLMFTKIEMVFKATDTDGMLLYNGYRTDRTGDFLSLALVDGYLNFMFDLGTGPALIKSRKAITINEWHTVRLERTGKRGEMVVDNTAAVHGSAAGAYTQLTLTLDLFIGGHRNYDEVNKEAHISGGFKGCVQKVVINDQPLKLLETYLHGVNVDNCDHPCMGQPCLNGGRCIPVGERYQCSCPLGFESTNCEDRKYRYRYRYKREIREPVTLPRFNGGSFLLYDDNDVMSRIKGPKIDVEMKIKATGPNGLIFWVGEEAMSPYSDYLAIGLDHGHPILRYNLGSGEIVVSYNSTRLDDGKWHKIKVARYHRTGYIEIDGTEIVEGTSPGNLKQLNVDNKLYIGGMPIDSLAQSTLKKFTTGFQGCITNVTLASDYRIHLLNDAINGENIGQCDL